MSTQRLIWILWCLAWASLWFFMGLLTFGVALILVPPSLLAILLPVGKPRPPTPPRPEWGRR